MRLDRFITLNLVQPCRRALRLFPSSTPQPLNSKWAVPILMYHSITDDPEPGVSPYYRVNTSPSVFRQHMQFLADHGYRTLTLDQLVSALRSAARTHNSDLKPQSSSLARPVVITFDDGFRNFYTEAFPVLQEHNFTATMFLPTAFIGGCQHIQGSRCDGSTFKVPPHSPFAIHQSRPDQFLTWNEVRELRKSGLEFGSHTVSHPKLVELDWPEIRSEVSNSKSEIEQQLAEPITAFCYPYAFPQPDRSFARVFSELLGETGYTCCTTTGLGRVQLGDDPYQLSRLPVNALDDAAFLAAKLDGSYDWLATPQVLVKSAQGRFCPARRGNGFPIKKPDTTRN